MGLEKDVPPGEKLVACFRPFLEHLASTSLSRKTIRKHVDNLWVLGGEIIRDLHEDPSLRRKDAGKILRDVIDGEGGPLIHGGSSEPQQNSFDSTCRKLRRFLQPTAALNPSKTPTNSSDEAVEQNHLFAGIG
jgi:hypothetical protein